MEIKLETDISTDSQTLSVVWTSPFEFVMKTFDPGVFNEDDGPIEQKH